MNSHLRFVHEVELEYSPDIDGVVVTSPYLCDFMLPDQQQLRFNFTKYVNAYDFLKKAIRMPSYSSALSRFKHLVPSFTLCPFASNYLCACFILKEDLVEASYSDLTTWNIEAVMRNDIIKRMATASLGLAITSKLNLIDSILHRNFKPKYFTVHSYELLQFSANLAETASDLPFNLLFLYNLFGQKKRFDVQNELTITELGLGSVVKPHPSTACRFSIHIGTVIR